jgi:predicted transcriptional regulator
MISRRLIDKYDMTQQEAADRLGLTQASISNYARKARGVMLNLDMDPNIVKAADEVAAIFASPNPDHREALRLMTEVCDYIRFNHLLCRLHADLEPGFQTEGCYACDGGLSNVNATIRLKTTS